MAKEYAAALDAINEGAGVIALDGGSCVVIDQEGRILVIRS